MWGSNPSHTDRQYWAVDSFTAFIKFNPALGALRG